jgi:proline iminopeptidase
MRLTSSLARQITHRGGVDASPIGARLKLSAVAGAGEDQAMSPRSPTPIAREGFVPLDGVRLFVRDLGDGLPIVMVHGGPDFDHEYLVPEIDRLGASFRVVYYDQRGRGRSFAGTQPDHVTMATEIDDLDRVRAWFGFESVVLLGHSWGGLLAMEYAVRHPQQVSHLVLMNTAPASHTGMLAQRAELARRRPPEQTERMNALRSDPRFLAGDIETEADYYRLHYGTTLPDDILLASVIRRLRVAFTKEGVLAARAIEDALYESTWSQASYDLIPALRQLDIPTLIIHGEHDFVPLDVVRRIADAIVGSHLVLIPACGHFAYLEQPAQIEMTITAFLTPA